MKLLEFWREIHPESGHLKRSFQVESGDTRFLGNLYQELSERATKKYALLQTPVFVEEFILDRTLNRAVDKFRIKTGAHNRSNLWLGALLAQGIRRPVRPRRASLENNEMLVAQKTLDGVWGVDINPFAVAMARLGLIVAAVLACGIKRLKEAPGWNIHLATGDSLLVRQPKDPEWEPVQERTGFARTR